MKTPKPPTAMPTALPPPINQTTKKELSNGDVWAVVVGVLGIVAILCLFGVYVVKVEYEARAYTMMLRAQAGNAPVSSHVACDFTLDNLMVREAPRDRNTEVFIDRITAHCEGDAQLPARLLTEATG